MSKKDNIILGKEFIEHIDYGSIPRPIKIGRPERNRKSHGEIIERRFKELWEEAEEENEKNKTIVGQSRKEGVYLKIVGKEGYTLITKSLENLSKEVRLYYVNNNVDPIEAIIFIPKDKKDYFLEKINRYKETETSVKELDTIDKMNLALLEDIWDGNKKLIPKNQPLWCEVWLFYNKLENPEDIKKEFFIICNELDLKYKEDFIIFPERLVVGVWAKSRDLTKIQYLTGRTTQISLMTTPTSFFTEDLDIVEQNHFIEDLVKRCKFKDDQNISICLLDGGVNNSHPLLEPILNNNHMDSVLPGGNIYDSYQNGRFHGTRMSGILGYFNLREKIESDKPLVINHKLESIKLIDPKQANIQQLYGHLTYKAVTLAEINNPGNKRIICMAITDNQTGNKNGSPSSWSGAIDYIINGNYGQADYIGKSKIESLSPKIMFISAGNTTIDEIINLDNYEDAVFNHSIEDPAQSWNAITVGGFTKKNYMEDMSHGYKPLVEKGCYSPFTSSSLDWDKEWPIKPDIVMEAGNLGYNKNDLLKYSVFDDLSLLTTNGDFQRKSPLTTINMTSSATAQASNIAAKLIFAYPELWLETIRGLIIHSAEWTDMMKKQVLGDKSVKPNRGDIKRLLGICGYGVPKIENVLSSKDNVVNMIIEDEIQPYKKGKGSPSMNQMKIHEIPWPKNLLKELGNTEIEMRITLSYYIEPGAGNIGWKDKYRYPSVNLSFDVNNIYEDKTNFMKRINMEARNDKKDCGDTDNDSKRWEIGIDNRNRGSVRRDTWRGSAVNLAESRYIGIYPIGGWWYSRPQWKRYNSSLRYSLIVTIRTPAEDINLYSEIENIIKTKTATQIEIEI